MGRFVAGLSLLLLLPAPGGAEVLEFESTLRLAGTAAGSPQIASGSGVADVQSSFGQLQTVRLLGGHVEGAAVVPITDPLVSNGGLVKIEISAALPLSASTSLGFDPFGGAFGSARLTRGTLPVRGERRNCLIFLDCGIAQTRPFSGSGSGSYTAGYGVGGLLTVGGSGTLRISLHAAPFTLGPITLSNPTESSAFATQVVAGFVHGPLSNSVSGANTLGGAGGAIQLVSPVRTQTLGIGGPSGAMHYVQLDVDFVPEPSSGLALALAAGLLLRFARSRGR